MRRLPLASTTRCQLSKIFPGTTGKAVRHKHPEPACSLSLSRFLFARWNSQTATINSPVESESYGCWFYVVQSVYCQAKSVKKDVFSDGSKKNNSDWFISTNATETDRPASPANSDNKAVEIFLSAPARIGIHFFPPNVLAWSDYP